ncbi:hypothetical protein SERLA73DRAFT_190992 [Serpula lacrymans var. lacrymans S7.3]|uniref:Uncharacterized protein n=2 Tax=Serpula lacrymans var. lacrymans TaxID=341189 RepID=F8QGS2_SERL3|nr:uncharacterized protein SERLADRAFT_457214 [Serpula lacrymans var. lacrymans S7.9]EGN92505.1 hypothetical protein SERLA73DRAFT_190992 [Serpula lacrymans var. lacrymans S7.3]EGO29447.1 hypothetical protein SERLADRAFT_457214 [Serpula lacrymans var. lacrymans S7.9]
MSKSNEDIIREQASSLREKSDYKSHVRFQPTSTATSEESGVNESGVTGFPGADVRVGRMGQTGGGTNPQIIPPEEGGEGKEGTMSDMYESTIGNKADIRAHVRETNPSVNLSGDNVRTEVSGTGAASGRRPRQELTEDQMEGARSRYV